MALTAMLCGVVYRTKPDGSGTASGTPQDRMSAAELLPPPVATQNRWRRLEYDIRIPEPLAVCFCTNQSHDALSHRFSTKVAAVRRARTGRLRPDVELGKNPLTSAKPRKCLRRPSRLFRQIHGLTAAFTQMTFEVSLPLAAAPEGMKSAEKPASRVMTGRVHASSANRS